MTSVQWKMLENQVNWLQWDNLNLPPYKRFHSTPGCSPYRLSESISSLTRRLWKLFISCWSSFRSTSTNPFSDINFCLLFSFSMEILSPMHTKVWRPNANVNKISNATNFQWNVRYKRDNARLAFSACWCHCNASDRQQRRRYEPPA